MREQDLTRNINIKLEDTTPIKCTCGNDRFIPVFLLRKVSALLAGKESILPVQVFECSACGEVLPESLPK